MKKANTPEYYGHLGGTARAKNLTPRQRSEIAKKAAKARWEKYDRERAAVLAYRRVKGKG